jgi:hypothetical protein
MRAGRFFWGGLSAFPLACVFFARDTLTSPRKDKKIRLRATLPSVDTVFAG